MIHEIQLPSLELFDLKLGSFSSLDPPLVNWLSHLARYTIRCPVLKKIWLAAKSPRWRVYSRDMFEVNGGFSS